MEGNILNKITDIERNKAKISFNAQKMTDELLALIGEREAKILRLRYGFEGQKSLTLDAIGKRFNLTRERVRQIENQAIKNIVKNKKYEEIVAPFNRLILDLVIEYGGVISEVFLINKLKDIVNDHQEAVVYIQFLLANFLSGLEKVAHSEFEYGWKSLDATFDLVLEIILTLENILTEKNTVMPETELLEHFTKTNYYKEKIDKINELLQKSNNSLNYVINSYLHASKKFTTTPFNQWGLAKWEHVNPKRINGKIYLVMLHHQKPLHFTDIAEIINKNWADHRSVKTATVHNELIFDQRFVLVGRGVYGLKEWGYTSGNVREVLKNILQEKGALSEEEIIKIMSDKKMVKPATIKLALKDENSFEKKDGKYIIKQID